MFKTVRLAALAMGASLIAVPAAAQDSPVLGTWNTEAVTDFGTFAATMIVAVEGDGYTVEIVDVPGEGPGAQAGPPMESAISDVSVDGSTFSFKRSLTTPQGPMDLSYTGSVEGDALTATVASGFGDIPVTGTRAE